MLPSTCAIVGVARTPMEDDSFRDHVREAVKEFGALADGETDLWETFARSLHYVTMDPSVPEEFDKLRSTLDRLCAISRTRCRESIFLPLKK